jgi:hypothetical protein
LASSVLSTVPAPITADGGNCRRRPARAWIAPRDVSVTSIAVTPASTSTSATAAKLSAVGARSTANTPLRTTAAVVGSKSDMSASPSRPARSGRQC